MQVSTSSIKKNFCITANELSFEIKGNFNYVYLVNKFDVKRCVFEYQDLYACQSFEVKCVNIKKGDFCKKPQIYHNEIRNFMIKGRRKKLISF